MNITINDKICECRPGEYLLEIAARNGIVIPSLCRHEGLPGQGCCRVCIVEAEIHGKRSIVTSCVYPVEQECAVFTDSDAIRKHRGVILAMLRARAPESAEIADLCKQYGAPEYGRFLKQEPEQKCILCGLCVKACESLGTGAISTVNRGVEKKVSTPFDDVSLVCVGCGSCAAVCPTGAIQVKEDETTRTIWNKTLNLKQCKNCGKTFGTWFELYRSAEKAGAEPSELCEECKKKAITDVMAITFGR